MRDINYRAAIANRKDSIIYILRKIFVDTYDDLNTR